MTNWPEYNNALRRHGDITIWFAEEAIAQWHSAKTGARGRAQKYSDLAIEAAPFIPQVFQLPLRQTKGFMNSLAHNMKASISIPDFQHFQHFQHFQAQHGVAQTCPEQSAGAGQLGCR